MNGRPAALPPLRWWGWGERETPVPPGLLDLLRDEAGVSGELSGRPPDLDAVTLPDHPLPAPLSRRLARIVGAANVRRGIEERVRHAAGRSYLDLLALRSGCLPGAPDAVVHPASAAEVALVLRACADAGCAVVPFGGGTSVVGGVAPARGPFAALITLDLERMNALVDVDTTSQTATLQAGMRGPRAETALRARGLTLGHFPQSFEYATVGGFAATRSAGQASTGYGRFDELTRGLRLIAPRTELNVTAFPASAAGPSLLELVLGSEGSFGVITDVTVRVHAAPRFRRYAGWSMPDFDSGTALLRDLAQRRVLPDVARLSDATETRASLAVAAGRAADMARRYLELRGQREPCLLVLGWEGDGATVGARERPAARLLRKHGAISLGAAPGRAWLHGRYDGPYLRDSLLDRGVLAETLETAAEWSHLHTVRAAVSDALQTSLAARGTPPLVGCHVSHVYGDGASLYFTVLAAQETGHEVAQWSAAKRAATGALQSAGGTLTHHHGVGVDHAAWLEGEVGPAGIGALRAVKTQLDPDGIMNPGKLLG